MNRAICERFERKISVSISGCWLWTGAHVPHGYGRMQTVKGVVEYTHRVSWQLHSGPIPGGYHVLHKCDVPACCNPSHLFLGTRSDNMRDMHAKGRGSPHIPNVRGEQHGHAIMTDDLVREIRASAEPGLAIARRLGTCNSNISRIRLRRSWAHVEELT